MDEEGFGDEGIEEERRLCYVGLTRAKKKLFVTNALMRRIYGQVNVAEASRFLKEIPAELVEAEIVRGENSMGFGVRSQWDSERSTGFQSWKGKSGGSGSYGSTTKSTPGDSRTYDYDQTPTYKVESADMGEGESLRVGQKVNHGTYGVGTVKLLEGSVADRKVTIDFGGKMTKKFSLKHVQLEVL